jgi:hypothetical protein
MAPNIFQPAHRPVRIDPDLESDHAVKIQLSRDFWILWFFAASDLALHLVRGGSGSYKEY